MEITPLNNKKTTIKSKANNIAKEINSILLKIGKLSFFSLRDQIKIGKPQVNKIGISATY